jgi:hypothetical protein
MPHTKNQRRELTAEDLQEIWQEIVADQMQDSPYWRYFYLDQYQIFQAIKERRLVSLDGIAFLLADQKRKRH